MTTHPEQSGGQGQGSILGGALPLERREKGFRNQLRVT